MKAVVLSGGVGGAKFVLGLSRSHAADDVTAIVNTGDDFRHLGLHISPDIDTLLYTLSDKAHLVNGWGRDSETWSFLDAVTSLGGPDWFRLGDGDLALHVLRSFKMGQGERLSDIIRDFTNEWDIPTRILPMTDDAVATFVETDEGNLSFQNYFVARQCIPRVRSIQFEGAREALPAPGVVEAILTADAVFIAPSNPFLSVDPLLAIPAINAALKDTAAPVIAISPLVGGMAVKGPTAKIMQELGLKVDNDTIASHYRAFVDALIVDEGDPAPSNMPSLACSTMMVSLDDKIRVAQQAITLARRLSAV